MNKSADDPDYKPGRPDGHFAQLRGHWAGKAELLTAVDGVGSRPVRRIVLLSAGE